MDETTITIVIISVSFFLIWVLDYINKKNKSNAKSGYAFNYQPKKIFKEQDHVTCLLCLKNGYILSGQMNGFIAVYNSKDLSPVTLIIEHCEPISSLFELNDGTILTSSAEGVLIKIRLFLNDDIKRNNKKKYLVEFVFYTNKEFIFKSIQLKNSDDILSCSISNEFILWKKFENEIELYKVHKILLKDEVIYDIFQINDNYLITSGDNIQCWDVKKYESIKKMKYTCKGTNSIYKLSEELTGILLKNKGDILIFNNNDLIEVKIINLSDYSISSLKLLTNNIIIVGIFDEETKRSFINQYKLNTETQKSTEEKSKDFKQLEMVLIKPNEFNYNTNDNNLREYNWSRINAIEQTDDYVILGIGGLENKKDVGKLIIFQKNK